MKIHRLRSIAAICVLSLGFLSCSTETESSTTTPPLSEPSQVTPPINSETKPAAQNKIQLTGRFVDGEHPTSGSVRIVEENEQYILELDSDFSTSTAGPDLVIILHRSDDVIGSTVPPAYPINEGDYVFVSALNSYSGAQKYTIPKDVDLAGYQSVAIWCRKFNATFGAAALQS